MLAVIMSRLAADFLDRGPLSVPSGIDPDATSPRGFFASRLFRLQVARWLCQSILSRDLTDTDYDLLELVDDQSKDIVDIATALLTSTEYFHEQAGDNFEFFKRRVEELFRFEPYTETDAFAFHAQDRSAFVDHVIGDKQILTQLAWSIYDTLRLDATKPQLRELIGSLPRAFFIEEVLSAAVEDETYLRDATHGYSSVDLAAHRLTWILGLFVEAEGSWGKKEAKALAADLTAGPVNYNRAVGLVAEFIRASRPSEKNANLIVGDALAEAVSAGPCRLYLTELLAFINQDRSRSKATESDYIQGASIFAEQVVAHWRSTFVLHRRLDERRLRFWSERLVLSDGLIEVLSEFLLSDQCLGAITRFIFDEGRISQAPGPFIRSSVQNPDLKVVVATTFFYWYDNTQPDGRGFIACPHALENENGEDSLTVSPENRECFSFRSYQWHRSELTDMREANINVVMPAAYNYPFSWEPTTVNGPRNYLAFADSGLRVFRRAWLDLSDKGTRPPFVAMFYDTSTLHKSNRFGLQVDFRCRYAKAWFYESIRNFFSHIPREMWAFYEGRPIIFVYHPSFGLALDDSLYPYVRDRFRRDFGIDAYIVTAAEEDAPRVINAELIADDAKALQTEKGVYLLAKALADDNLYIGAQSNDATYASGLAGRLFSDARGESLIARCMHGALSDPGERVSFVMRLLTSQEFAWRMVERWFQQLLRRSFNVRDLNDRLLADEVRGMLTDNNDWLGALAVVASSDAFYAAAGGTDEYFIDWIYQSIVLKHPNETCTPGYHKLWADPAGKAALLSDLRSNPRRQALERFFSQYEVCEAIVSAWRFDYSGWYNPGPADSSFYWSAAISPMIRGVASIGPGYDQSKCRQRSTLRMPRQDGKTYQDVWSWLLAMNPRPKIVHIETWNEFFEGTPICRSKEFGDQYIRLTKQYAGEFLAEANEMPGSTVR